MFSPTLTLVVLLIGQASSARIRNKAPSLSKLRITLEDSRKNRAAALKTEIDSWNAANLEYFEAPDDVETKPGQCPPKTFAMTRQLFNDVNHKLVEWEMGTDAKLKCPEDNHVLETAPWPASETPDVAIVYGGKPPSEDECSGECALDSDSWHKGTYTGMPSALVAALWSLLPGTTVISVSTRPSARNMTGSNIHVQGDLLAENPDGILDLIDTRPELFATKKIMLFMTYAAHKPDPAASLDNIKAAENVGKDLLKLKMVTSKVHVVLTGTDATNKPSDTSRQYSLGQGNYHYGLSKIAQGFHFEYLSTGSKHAKKAFDKIKTFIEGLGDFEDPNSIGKRMDRSSAEDLAIQGMDNPAFKVGSVQGGKFSSAMSELFQDTFEFKETSIVQIGVMLTDLHVPRKCMVSEKELSLPFKGTEWMKGALSVIISPQYSAMKHLTYVPGRITN